MSGNVPGGAKEEEQNSDEGEGEGCHIEKTGAERPREEDSTSAAAFEL